MIIRALTKPDFDDIVQVVERWFGREVPAGLDPLFFYELGALSRVVVEDSIVVGFAFGFVWGTTGHLHLLGCHPDFRRRGVATVLCDTFEEECRAADCDSIKAVLGTTNQSGRAFCEARGFCGEIVDNYAGPGRSRWVATRALRSFP